MNTEDKDALKFIWAYGKVHGATHDFYDSRSLSSIELDHSKNAR